MSTAVAAPTASAHAGQKAAFLPGLVIVASLCQYLGASRNGRTSIIEPSALGIANQGPESGA